MLLADTPLARRLEAHEAAGMAGYASTLGQRRPETGATARPLDGGRLVFSGAHHPITRAVGLGMTGPVTAETLDLAEEFFRQRGAPVRIDVSPHTDPSLIELLGQRGYRIQFMRNVLVRSPEPAPEPVPGVSVAAVRTPEEAALWVLAVSRGFAGDDAAGIDEISENNPHAPHVTCYLARVDGEPAGGGCLAVADGLGACFSGSTRPAFRRRGVQTALIAARLAAAAAAGCELVSVQANAGSPSHRNLERAGFRVAYTRITMIWEWDR